MVNSCCPGMKSDHRVGFDIKRLKRLDLIYPAND